MNDTETKKRIEKIEELIRHFDEAADPKQRADAVELVQALMDLHSTCLGRIAAILADNGEAGRRILEQLGTEETISSLLILYGLHPASLSDRIALAIKELQPALEPHNGKLEVLRLEGQNLILRLTAKPAGGCHSSEGQLKQAVEAAIIGAAPDIEELTIEELAVEPPLVLVPLKGLARRKSVATAPSAVLT